VSVSGAVSGGSDLRSGFLTAAAVLTGAGGLLVGTNIRPVDGRGATRRRLMLTAEYGRRVVHFVKSLWRRVIA